MLKKTIKVSLLVLFMASSVSLTSCKKKSDPKPSVEVNKEAKEKEAKEKEEKEAKEKAEKARILKLLTTNKWQNKKESTDIYALVFSADSKVSIYNFDFIKRKNTYTLSMDPITLTIDGDKFTIKDITSTSLTLVDANKKELVFKNVTSIDCVDTNDCLFG